MRYAVIAEGPDTRVITEDASRAAAVLVIEREVERLQAAGGSIARWHEHGHLVSLRRSLFGRTTSATSHSSVTNTAACERVWF